MNAPGLPLEYPTPETLGLHDARTTSMQRQAADTCKPCFALQSSDQTWPSGKEAEAPCLCHDTTNAHAPGAPHNTPPHRTWPSEAHGSGPTIATFAEALKTFGQTPDARQPAIIGPAEYHNYASLMRTVLPQEICQTHWGLINAAWKHIDPSCHMSFYWLQSFGDHLLQIASGDLLPSASSIGLAKMLSEGRLRGRMSLGDALSTIHDTGLNPPTSQRIADTYRIDSCTTDDIPVDIYLIKKYGNIYGLCEAIRLNSGYGGRPQSCLTGEPVGALDHAWGFACTHMECEDTGAPSSQDAAARGPFEYICRPFLRPGPQGRPGQSEFKFYDITWIVDDVWMRPNGDMFHLVHVAMCDCIKRRRRRQQKMTGVDVAVTVLFYAAIGLALVGSGGTAAPIIAIARSTALKIPA